TACPTATGGCGAVVNYPAPIATDNSGAVAVTCNPPSGTFFPCGTHSVVCEAKDRCGNSARCEFKVVVVQGRVPKITCPPDITVVTCEDRAIVQFPPPVVDPPGTSVICTPPSGSSFPIGTTAVICVASNECGVVRCEFRVVVRKGTPPVIECPKGPITFTIPCDRECMPIQYPAPEIANGALASCTPPPGTCLPPGEHVVTCVATNECGRSVCEFKVVIARSTQGGEPPVIRCPQDIIVAADCDQDCVKVEYPNPVILNGALAKCEPPSGSCFPVGTNVVTCLATNGCGASRCQFQVIVRKPAPVEIRCPQTITVETCDDCAVVNFPDPLVVNGTLESCSPKSGTCFPVGTNIVACVATNRCSKDICRFQVIVRKKPLPRIRCPEDMLVTTCDPCEKVEYPRPVVLDGALASCTPASGTCLPPGVHVVTCVATNDCGKSECKFTITVRRQGEGPVIRCPGRIIVETCETGCVKVDYPPPAVANGVLVRCTPPSGSCFPIGTTWVTCLASNACGIKECRFPVIVRRKPAPVIHCPDNLVLETCNDCAPLQFPAPTVLNGSLASCNPPIGTCLPIGQHVISCIATNECGRSECKFTVTVRKQRPVDIKCPPDIHVRTCGQGETVHYPRPEIIGADDPSSYVLRCEPPPGSFFPVGTNTVLCCVIDRCTQQRRCCEFKVIVTAGQPCVKPPANMVLWHTFDEPAGPIALNSIPGAPNGLHINGPIPILGQKVLNSLGFDGLNDFVGTPNYAAIVLNTNDFTIDAWVLRREEQGRRVIVSKVGQGPTGAAPRGYEFYLANGVMRLWLSGATGVQDVNSGALVPVDNAWHHVAVMVSRSGAGAVRFMLDGNVVATLPGPVPNQIGNTSRLYVGAGTFPNPHSFFRGGIDEVEIFNRALTPVEVRDLWLADRFGKCKIKCRIAWDNQYPVNGGPLVTPVTICNCSGVRQVVTWSILPGGPVPPIGPSSGIVVLNPGQCTNVMVTLGRPTVNVPVGSRVEWQVVLYPTYGCPIICRSSIINPGPVSSTAPVGTVPVPGTQEPVDVRVGLNGLPPGSPIRIRAIGPDMEPDLGVISLNGLPPGTPWVLGTPAAPAADEFEFLIPIQFLVANPNEEYTILIQMDLNEDGEWDTLRSFDLSNPVVSPPVLSIESVDGAAIITWTGNGVLESSEGPDGPWTAIPGATSGHKVQASEKRLFFRVLGALPELELPVE
ncbi:MAG: HYR domain-containing protein, partial [Verrucomicrobia bacterium]|nr:HYR domain-containing protein [Verrucomicrobiota bacterium]